MKIVHIVEALGGGVYTYFKDLSFFFGAIDKKENIETFIIYSGNRKEIDSLNIRELFSKNVTLIEVFMVKEFSPLQDLKSTVNLIKELKKINPDVIHLHSSKAGVIGRVAGFFLFKKNKLFYTPHGYSFLRTDISKFKRKTFKIIEQLIQAFFGGTTIACGDTDYNIATKIGKSQLIRNGVSIKEIGAFYDPQINEILTIGIVGRITVPKNPILYNAIALQFPSFNFIWIGDGELKDLLTAPNITITGWLYEQNQVMERLNSIDVYMQTSIWEGLPIAVLEAMVLKKPVIATNVIGNKDIVLHGETGFLFDNIEELGPYFEIFKNSHTREIFGEKGLERCKIFFDKNKNFRQLTSLYQQYHFVGANKLQK